MSFNLGGGRCWSIRDNSCDYLEGFGPGAPTELILSPDAELIFAVVCKSGSNFEQISQLDGILLWVTYYVPLEFEHFDTDACAASSLALQRFPGYFDLILLYVCAVIFNENRFHLIRAVLDHLPHDVDCRVVSFAVLV